MFGPNGEEGGALVRLALSNASFGGAVRNGDLSHDGSYRLTAHVLQTRRRVRSGKLTVAKEHDYSARKIDACVAAILAYQARRARRPARLGRWYRRVWHAL
jgi:hypothetical protein